MRRLLALAFLLLASLAAAQQTPAPVEPLELAPPSPPQPLQLDDEGRRWAEDTLAAMPLDEKVGQLILAPARVQFFNAGSRDYLLLRDLVRRAHVGGFVLASPIENGAAAKGQPYEAAALTNRLQAEASVPLIFAADFERGLAMRLSGATGFPHAMAFGAAQDVDAAFLAGQITAREARAIGVHWDWFPVADLSVNPDNPIVNIRSYGEDPHEVGRLASAFIAGARGAGMMTAVKHFPGHGATVVDTHLELAAIPSSAAQLDASELIPFRMAIDAGVDAVMTAHLAVPLLDRDPLRPASVSPAVVTDLLRGGLGFRGLAVTDGLEMASLMRAMGGSPAVATARAAVAAILAGEDVLVLPADVEAARRAILAAVRSGELSEARIDQSVRRILLAKASIGLHRKRFVDLNALDAEIARPESLAAAQRVAEESITLVKNDDALLPLRADAPAAAPVDGTSALAATYSLVRTVVVFADEARSCEGCRLLERQLRVRWPQAHYFFVDDASAAAAQPAILAAAEQSDSLLAVVDITPTGGRTAQRNGKLVGSASLGDASLALLRAMARSRESRLTLLSLGNPYVLAELPRAAAMLCAYSDMSASVSAAVKVLFGELPPRGRLPISIPGLAPRGHALRYADGPAPRP